MFYFWIWYQFKFVLHKIAFGRFELAICLGVVGLFSYLLTVPFPRFVIQRETKKGVRRPQLLLLEMFMCCDKNKSIYI